MMETVANETEVTNDTEAIANSIESKGSDDVTKPMIGDAGIVQVQPSLSMTENPSSSITDNRTTAAAVAVNDKTKMSSVSASEIIVSEPPQQQQQQQQQQQPHQAKVNTDKNTTNNNNVNNNNNATLLAENEALKEKVSKLKALLGRSAKAQRETKNEVDMIQKKYQEVIVQNEKLQEKIIKLSNRPTYVEMLADFETNFDRALLSVGNNVVHQQQAGGQDTASPHNTMMIHSNDNYNNQNNHSIQGTTSSSLPSSSSSSAVDTMLLQELNDAKQRIDKLERLNQALVERTKHMESDIIGQYQRQLSEVKNTLQRVELEKRMALLESENAIKELQSVTANVTEMQMEINLLTQSNKKLQMKASVNEELVKNIDYDKNRVQQLEQQIKALEEWAIASNEAKALAQQHARTLEQQLINTKKLLVGSNGPNSGMNISGDGTTTNRNNSTTITGLGNNGAIAERVVLTKNGSCVVGAGDIVYKCLELDETIVKTILLSERVLLRWKFDLQSHDRDIIFSIIKGTCLDNASALKKSQSIEDCLICNRTIIGGAEGETDHAFAYQRSCTLVWNNKMSWIRPKTIKYTIDAIVV